MAELIDVADRVLGYRLRGEDVEAFVQRRTTTTVQVGAGTVVRHVGRAETRGVGVQVIIDSRMGYASTADLSAGGLHRAVSQARANALAADPDQAVGLPQPEPAEAAGNFWDPALGATSMEAKITIATELARRVTGIDARIASLDTAEYHDEHITTAIVSSHGLRIEHHRGYAEAFVDALGEGADGAASDYGYWCGRDPSSIDVHAVAGDAVARTTRLLAARVAATAGLPVVLDGAVVAPLLLAVGRACSGGPLSSGRSVFNGRQGTAVGADAVTLVDHGLLPAAPGAATYDDEGLPRRRTELVNQGVLVGALHTTASASAIRVGAASSGNAHRATHKSPPRAAPTALLLEPNCTLTDLLMRDGDAVYLQQLTGSQSGISSITGRVNVGGLGWLMRNGQPAGRLPTLSIATSLTAFLAAIQLVADDARPVLSEPVVASTVLCSADWLTT